LSTTRVGILTTVAATAVVVMAAAAAGSARFKSGALPSLPDARVGAGEVLLEADVDAAGAVSEVRVLRDTPPYTERLQNAVRGWSFEPAHDAQGAAVPSSVLVGGSYSPTTLMGPGQGEPPRDVARPSSAVPFPSATAPALYPPNAQNEASVLVEVQVAADGTIQAVTVARPAPGGFDEAARQAARQWRFRSAGIAGAQRVYVVFGFRRPETTGVRPGN
jgi:TonB family protein